jgi:hypothetical protein
LRHALRDLTLLDGALARLAAALQMNLADYDTAPSVDRAEIRARATSASLAD